jgi:hypothetical protein
MEINTCINLLLSCIHERELWLDPPVSIDMQLIARIMGLPTTREDPTILFAKKVGEKALSKSMKDNFNTFRENQGLDVASISDYLVRFETQVLACKLLRKCRKDEVLVAVIATTKKCIEGVQMNWATFLVNHFLVECTGA